MTEGRTAEIIEAASRRDFERARELIEAYARAPGMGLRVEDLAEELADLGKKYGPTSRGCILLALEGGAAVGCAALRRHDEAACEMKRLYVAPSSRRRGVGKRLVQALIDRARRLGYRRMLLDTLPDMAGAQALYESFGFRETERYHDDPMEVRFMALDLAPGPGGPPAVRPPPAP